MNYQNSSERINETRRNKYGESCKTKEDDVFKIKKRIFNDHKYSKLCGTMEHERLKVRKRKQHKTFLDNIRRSPQHEKRKGKIRIRKRNRLKIEFRHLKQKFKKVPFMYV